MIVYEVTGTELHPVYKRLEYFNSDRQLYFLESMVEAALKLQRRFLSQTLIKALNFHAIACLHVNAGEYRPCEVAVDDFHPPAHYRVAALMDDFVNDVNLHWTKPIRFFYPPSCFGSSITFIPSSMGTGGRPARAAILFFASRQVDG